MIEIIIVKDINNTCLIQVVTFPPEDLADIAGTDKFVQNIRNKRDWEFKWLEKLRN